MGCVRPSMTMVCNCLTRYFADGLLPTPASARTVLVSSPKRKVYKVRRMPQVKAMQGQDTLSESLCLNAHACSWFKCAGLSQGG